MHNSRFQQAGSICSIKQKNYVIIKHYKNIVLTQIYHLRERIPSWSTCLPLTKVVSGGVKVLLWRGAGEGQPPAQAAVVHHHIQEGRRRHHLHHTVQRPNRQVGTVQQRLPRPGNMHMWSGSLSQCVHGVRLQTEEEPGYMDNRYLCVSEFH